MTDTETALAPRDPDAPVKRDRDPDALVKEIELTRDNLARTIDAITDRVNPANVARRTITRARQQAARVDPRLAAAGAVAAVAVTAFLIRRRRR
jgi:hypothetical protein